MSGLSGGDGGGGGGVVRVISARFRVRVLAGLPGRLGAQALIFSPRGVAAAYHRAGLDELSLGTGFVNL